MIFSFNAITFIIKPCNLCFYSDFPQRISRLMKWADCTLVYIITSSSQFVRIRRSTIFRLYHHDSMQLFGINVNGFRCLLRRALVKKYRPAQSKTPAVLSSMQLSGAMAREAITISFVALPELQVVMIESDSNEPTIPYGYETNTQLSASMTSTCHPIPPIDWQQWR